MWLETKIESAASGILTFFRRKTVMDELVTLLLALLATRATLLSMLAPFGAAMLAALWMNGKNYYCALAGCIIGALIAPAAGIRVIAICAAFTLGALLLRLVRKKLGKRELFVTLMVVTVAVNGIFAALYPDNILLWFGEGAIELLMAGMFKRALEVLKNISRRRIVSNEEAISLSLFAGTLVLGLGGLGIFGFTPSIIATVALTMLITCAGGMATGAAAGVGLSLMLCAGEQAQIMFIGVAAACALVGGALRSMGRGGVVTGFALCDIIIALYMQSSGQFIQFTDLATASFMVILLPPTIMRRFGAIFDSSLKRRRRDSAALQTLRDVTTQRITGIADAIGEVGALIECCDGGYDFVKKQLTGISAAMHSLTGGMQLDMTYDEPLEASIIHRLDGSGIIVNEVTALRDRARLKVDIIMKPQTGCMPTIKRAVTLAAQRPMRIIKRHYSLSGEWRIELEDAYAYDITVNAAMSAREGNIVSGDNMAVQELGGGRVLAALSDGMGSGETAWRESSAAVVLLEKLLRAGFSRSSVLDTINRLLMIRSTDDSFATIDACLIDMTSGRGEFIKLGAPPSCIVRGNKAFLIHSESLPAGIVEEARAAVHEVTFKSGDTLVLMTDGVFDVMGEEIVQTILEAHRLAPDELARFVLSQAKALGAQDDASVAVIRILSDTPLRSDTAAAL